MQLRTREPRIPEIRLRAMPEFETPGFDLSAIDVGKAVTGAAAAIGLIRPRSSRRRYVIGFGIVAGLAAVTYMNSAAIRDRLARAMDWVNERLGRMSVEAEDDDAVAFTAAATAKIQPSRGSDMTDATTDYAEGLGAPSDTVNGSGDGITTYAGAGRRG